MLVLSRRPGERILIGEGIVVTVIHTAGGRVRLGVEAPREIAIAREEVRHRQACTPTVLAAPMPLVDPLESICT